MISLNKNNMTFKHGQKVKCEIYGREITDARISINKSGIPYICQNKEDGIAADDKLGYEYSWMLNKDFTGYSATNLRLAEKSFDNPEVGDEYRDAYGNGRFVLGVSGRVIHLSMFTGKNSVGDSFTKEELIKYGYTIVQDKEEEVTELTLDEIAKKFGKDVSKIKIKK
jgi:hypothetical protein